MLSQWFKCWRQRLDAPLHDTHRGPRVRRRPRCRPRCRPQLELLEDRITPSVVDWIGGPGDWSNASNWLDTITGTQHVPGPDDVAEIAADVAVTHSTGSDTVDALILNNPFSLSGGSLRVTNSLLEQNGNLFTLDGGVLAGAVVDAGTTIVGSNLGGTLDSITLNGTLDLATNNNATVNIASEITLNGTIKIGANDGSTYDTLAIAGTQALVNTTSSGSIVFGGSPFNSLVVPAPAFTDPGTTLTITAGVTIDGQSGVIGTGMPAWRQTTLGGTLINDGTMAADAAGAPSPSTPPGTLTIASAVFTNNHVVQVSNAESLNLGLAPPAPSTAWDNSFGTVGVAGGTLNLNGTVNASALGTFSRAGGTVNLAGTLNSNSDAGLVLDDTTGPWILAGGTINGGAVTTNGNNTLHGGPAGYYGPGTLNGVTFDGLLDLATNDNTITNVTGGLTLNGTIKIGAADGSTIDTLVFVGTQTVSTTTNGGIVFGGSPFNSIVIPVTTPTATTLTVGPGIVIDGRSGVIGTGIPASRQTTTGGNLINNGTIAADAAGAPTGSAAGSLVITGTGLTNTATLRASNSETLSIGRSPSVADTNWTSSGTIGADTGTLGLYGASWANRGTITSINNSTVNLGSTFTLANLGTFNRAGGTVNLVGTLTNNSAAGLVLDDATGPWNLAGGTINGGSITTNGSNNLRAADAGNNGGDILYGITLTGIEPIGAPAPVLDLAANNNALVSIVGGLILNGTIAIGAADGSTFDTLAFTGSQAVSTSSTGTIAFGGSPVNSIVIPATTPTATTVTINPGVTIDGQNGAIGTGIPAWRQTTTGGNLVNNGTIAADGGGTLAVLGVANFAPATGTLTGGTWKAIGASALRLLGANVVTNAATIVLDGAGARVFRDNNATNALAGLAVNTATGAVTIQNGADLTAGALTNQGSVIIGPGSTLTTPTFTNGGTLAGAGVVAADVVNNGVVSPGMSPGILTISGNYTQSTAGVLDTQLAGTAAGTQYDRLKITASATLDGTLNVTLLNGFQPSAGDSFQITTFGSVSGDFATENGLALDGGLALMPVYAPTGNPTSLSLAVGAMPVAVEEDFTTSANTTLTVQATGVLGNDTGFGLIALPIVDDTHPAPSNGLLTLNPDGSLTYVPDSDFSGTDSFSYRAGDGTGQLSNVVTDTITINPVAVTDSFSTAFNTSVSFFGSDLVANDIGTEPLSAALVSGMGPTHGSLVVNFDGLFTYQPDATFSGTDAFTYQATDANGLVSNPVTDTLVVVPPELVTNTTVVAEPPASSSVGQEVTFTATITDTADRAAPTGSVDFFDGSTDLGPGSSLIANGSSAVSTFTTATLNIGSHNIQAVYTPTGSFQASDGSVTETIIDSTATSVTSSANPSAAGQDVTFTAGVTALTSAFDDGGTVQFAVDGANFGGPIALSNGSASITISSLAVGGSPHTITATYGGDSGFAGSSGSLMQTVEQGTRTLLAVPAVWVVGQTVVFTAVVKGDPATIGMPTGSVTFTVDGTDQAPIQLIGAVAPFITNTLGAGAHTVLARYSGDGNFIASVSKPLTQPVTSPVVAITGPSSVIAGTRVNLVVAVQDGQGNPMTNFTGSIAVVSSDRPRLTRYTFTAKQGGRESFSITPQNSGTLNVSASGPNGLYGATALTVAPGAPYRLVLLSVALQGKAADPSLGGIWGWGHSDDNIGMLTIAYPYHIVFEVLDFHGEPTDFPGTMSLTSDDPNDTFLLQSSNGETFTFLVYLSRVGLTHLYFSAPGLRSGVTNAYAWDYAPS